MLCSGTLQQDGCSPFLSLSVPPSCRWWRWGEGGGVGTERDYHPFHGNALALGGLIRVVGARSSSYGGVAALQERLGVPQEQPVVGIHHVGLPLGHGGRLGFLFLLLLVVLVLLRAVERLVPAAALLQERLLRSGQGDSTISTLMHDPQQQRLHQLARWSLSFGDIN